MFLLDRTLEEKRREEKRMLSKKKKNSRRECYIVTFFLTAHCYFISEVNS